MEFLTGPTRDATATLPPAASGGGAGTEPAPKPALKPWAEKTAEEKLRTAKVVLWGTVAFLAMFGVCGAYVASYEAPESDPVADACADAVGIENTAALARCIQLREVGVSSDNAKEIDGTLDRWYGTGR